MSRPSSIALQGPFVTLDLPAVRPTTHAGAAGSAEWKTVEDGVRVRLVEYSPGYVADHWCSRGHVLHVLEGELVTELEDGREFVLRAGQGYRVGSDGPPHRSRTALGAKLFIVD